MDLRTSCAHVFISFLSYVYSRIAGLRALSF